jgi:hypothetical protein
VVETGCVTLDICRGGAMEGWVRLGLAFGVCTWTLVMYHDNGGFEQDGSRAAPSVSIGGQPCRLCIHYEGKRLMNCSPPYFSYMRLSANDSRASIGMCEFRLYLNSFRRRPSCHLGRANPWLGTFRHSQPTSVAPIPRVTRYS